jgi:hypothetical protein
VLLLALNLNLENKNRLANEKEAAAIRVDEF